MGLGSIRFFFTAQGQLCPEKKKGKNISSKCFKT